MHGIRTRGRRMNPLSYGAPSKNISLYEKHLEKSALNLHFTSCVGTLNSPLVKKLTIWNQLHSFIFFLSLTLSLSLSLSLYCLIDKFLKFLTVRRHIPNFSVKIHFVLAIPVANLIKILQLWITILGLYSDWIRTADLLCWYINCSANWATTNCKAKLLQH